MEYLKQFKIHLTNNDLPHLVTLWEEYCLCDEVDPEEVQQILESIKISPLADSFGIYVDQILPLWENIPNTPVKNTIFKLVIDIQTSNSPKLAEKTTLYLQTLYGNDPEFANKLRLVGLREREEFRGAVSNMELLNHLKPHNFVFHTGGWGVGEIMDVSFIREEISLEFDYVAGLKDLSFKNGFNTLIPLSKEHFLARRFGDADGLEKQAKTDSVSVVKLLLKDLGPKTASEVKDELCELVIPEDEWTKWWQAARAKVKKDTLIESPKSIKSPFKLRKSEVSHEERLQKILEKKPDVNALIEIIYSFVRDFPTALKNSEFKSTLILQLKDIGTHKEISPAQELQILFFLSDLSGSKDEDEIGQFIQNVTNFEELIDEITIIAFKKQMLSFAKKFRDDWTQIFLDLFLTPLQTPTRDYILQQLLKAGKTSEVEAKIEQLLAHPQNSSHAFLWYFNKVMDKPTYPFANQNGKNRFLETFFVLMYLLEREQNQRDLLKKMHNFLTNERYAIVRKIFDGAPIENVREILLLSTKSQTLDEHDIKILQSLAQVVHPELVNASETPKEVEDVLWTTEEGYLKIKARMSQIATVETVENAKEIEVARAHGDLRENSEFKYALEKRQQLQSELKVLGDQMNQMRVISTDDIDIDEIGVGTKVSLENDQGTIATYVFLGPWDTDLDKNILSYHSKFAQSLVGAKIGEKRKVQNEQWTVKEIKSYLD
ncbi:MAG: GreA/GreB family elongation factor [Rhabdochlamydiaceae bacterium]|nr:GreA/GreB family elongation factor [Candidatus Amphrikana amoebophyrae]